MKYLTRSYVQWLGLKRIPIQKLRNQSYGHHHDLNCTLPSPQESFAEGVQHEGVLYEREPDGLAYVRL